MFLLNQQIFVYLLGTKYLVEAEILGNIIAGVSSQGTNQVGGKS